MTSPMIEVTGAPPHTDADRRQVSVPVKDSTAMLIAAGQRLQEAGVALADLGVRHPTLDDVFLALTGTRSQASDRATEEVASR